MTHSFDYDVIVVGAGPSGLTTATSLARAGTSVLVIEKHPGLSIFPKATGLRPRTMEILRSWGLDAAVAARTQPARLAMSIAPMLAVPGTEVSMGLPSDDELDRVSPCRIAVCSQDRLEHILLEHLLDRGGEVSFSTELTDLRSDIDGVRLQVVTAEGPQTLTARYLVGADGARSRVREALGIPNERLGSEGAHLSALFRADLSEAVGDTPHVLQMVVAPGVEGMFVTTGEPDRWIYDIEWHPEAGETLADWPDDRMAARISAATGLPGVNVEILGLFPWDFGAAAAERQRDGRVFLVGDAAHRTTPRGATGMNTGIADGHNLGWKLAWVVRGWAEEPLLDSYNAERAPVGRANAEASLMTQLGGPPDSGLAQDFGVVYPSLAALTADGPDAAGLAGHRAPHAWITLGGRSVSTLDLFDGRLTVLTGPAGEHWRRVAAELARAGVPVAVFSAGRDFTDPADTVTTAYDLAPDGCVLVRPDGYVAWCSAPTSGPDDLRRVVRATTGRIDTVELASVR